MRMILTFICYLQIKMYDFFHPLEIISDLEFGISSSTTADIITFELVFFRVVLAGWSILNTMIDTPEVFSTWLVMML